MIGPIFRFGNLTCALAIIGCFALISSAHADLSSVPAESAGHGKLTAPKELQALVFRATTENRDRLLADYRTLLQVYFELKKQSSQPTEFQNPAFNSNNPATLHTATTTRPAEFASVHYDEFKSQLDRDPRLKGNTFVGKMRTYGGGQANDLFQRVAASTLEEMGIQDGPLFRKLYRSVGRPIEAVGMLLANDTFADVSRENGYRQLGRPTKPEALAEWTLEVRGKEAELSQELAELKKSNQSAKSVQGKDLKPAKACAFAYGKL